MCPSSSRRGFGGLATSSASDTWRYSIRLRTAKKSIAGNIVTERIIRQSFSDAASSAFAAVGAPPPGTDGSPRNGRYAGSCPNIFDAMHSVPTHAAAPKEAARHWFQPAASPRSDCVVMCVTRSAVAMSVNAPSCIHAVRITAVRAAATASRPS